MKHDIQMPGTKDQKMIQHLSPDRTDSERVVRGICSHRRPLDIRFFEWYASGNYSLKEVTRKARQAGLTFPKSGNPIITATVHKILRNPGLTFPDLNASPFGGENFQTNLILPEPCSFLRRNLPVCSVIRPFSTDKAGAVAAVQALTADQLFLGQPKEGPRR